MIDNKYLFLDNIYNYGSISNLEKKTPSFAENIFNADSEYEEFNSLDGYLNSHQSD
jgi:hypothetical protein